MNVEREWFINKHKYKVDVYSAARKLREAVISQVYDSMREKGHDIKGEFEIVSEFDFDIAVRELQIKVKELEK